MRARAAFALALVLAGCSGDEAGEAPGSGGAGGAGGASSAAPSSGASNLTTGSGAGLDACATESRVAERFPLDLYVMLDASGSMASAVAGGESKWAAVSEALSTFFGDPRSKGVSAALGFFPEVDPEVPSSCATSQDCEGRGPCANRVCAAEPFDVPCDVDADCGEAKCVDKGRCLLSDAPCLGDPLFGCEPAEGPCVKDPASYCAGRDSCDPADYAEPHVPFSPLPASASALRKALEARFPDGETPTAPALEGALARAAEAGAAKGHVAAVLLVTDGLPSECAPVSAEGVAAIAAKGAKGEDGVPTFVVGVFSPEEREEAKSNLDLVASAGGTGAARIVGTDGDVASELAEALEAVRTRALPCELVVPKPASGTPDYGKVNVLFSPGEGGAPLLIPSVPGASACAAEGGWHYDVPPSEGAPQKIALCPATCSALRADSAGRLDVVLGCATQVR